MAIGSLSSDVTTLISCRDGCAAGSVSAISSIGYLEVGMRWSLQ